MGTPAAVNPPTAVNPPAAHRSGGDASGALALTLPVEPQVRPLQQWWVLTQRGIAKVVRNGEFIFAFVSPAFLAICFYLPLRSIMDSAPGMSYGQFLMPIIVLQSVGFAASSAAMRAALDSAEGINTRFRVLPMSSVVPMSARTVTNLVLLAVSLACAAIACLLIGWRPEGGVAGVLGLFGLAALFGTLLALVADGIGLLAGSPEATSQSMALPTLILGMLSTGFVPLSQFPEWIQPFVRNQPISQLADSMRALDSGSATWDILRPSMWWCAGLAVTAVVLLWLGNRKVRT
ncbi:ABC transporter permease [Gordonia sp. ABSL1-1]|uniref:ABC transporter permease n=1 Tax=Gordonia sp. ABSL1-1 TaxID=3053923 RepID=UPI00257293A7|nr:ABC transporter permease [Gordonia sp. ABSL1-1]MDL9937933.1 ABC transporter permease [Gordonia sp. ABSL1-1]